MAQYFAIGQLFGGILLLNSRLGINNMIGSVFTGLSAPNSDYFRILEIFNPDPYSVKSFGSLWIFSIAAAVIVVLIILEILKVIRK